MERRRTLGNEVAESMINEEFELVGTVSITEETATVEIQLSKPCTDVYLFCENLKSTNNSQLIIRLGTSIITGINAEISTNAQNTIQHIKKVGKTWVRTGNNHATYGLQIGVAQMYRLRIIPDKWTPESISSLVLLLQNNFNFTSGTIEIYGR